MIHIYLQQGRGRRSITIVYGVPDKVCTKLLHTLRKKLCCSGTLITHEELGTAIQLQGDHRISVRAMLIQKRIAKPDDIHVHGY